MSKEEGFDIDKQQDTERYHERAQAEDTGYPGWHDETQWNRLPKRVITVWFISSAIADVAVLLICAVASVVLHRLQWWGWWQETLVIAAAALSVLDLLLRPVISRYEYAVNRFILGEHEVSIRKGWFLRTLTVIPYNRVQHVETKQGPLLHAFSMTSVEVHTAVGSHKIDALEIDDAHRVVSQITAKVRIEKEDL
jgi:membrane protein YdbS with pleckstrin-like domain